MERVSWNHNMDVQGFLEHMNKAAATWLDNVHDAAVKHGCVNALIELMLATCVTSTIITTD